MNLFEIFLPALVLAPLLLVSFFHSSGLKRCSKCGKIMHGDFAELPNGKPSYDYTCNCGYRVKYFPYPFPHSESTWSFKFTFWLSHPYLLSMWGYRAFRFEFRHPYTDLSRFAHHHSHLPHLPFNQNLNLRLPSLNFGIYFWYAFNAIVAYSLSLASSLYNLQTNGYIPVMAFSADGLKKSLGEERCYCGTIVKNAKFTYDNLVFCSESHLESFKSSRVDPLCGLILPFDPLQAFPLKANITQDKGFIRHSKKYVFCSTQHRDAFATKNGVDLNLPDASNERRGFLKLAGGVGAGLIAAFTLGRLSVPISALQTNSKGADPSFGANGVGLPSLAIDPSPLPPNGYLWYRSDLNVVRTASNGSAFSIGVRPFISISPNGPDMYGDYGANSPSTKTNGFQEAINYLNTQGNGTYATGGVLEVSPGNYNFTTNAVLTLPVFANSKVFDMTWRGSGKSNTTIYINAQSSQTSAIQSQYTAWNNGTNGPRLTFENIGFSIQGTFSSHVVDFSYYSAFMKNALWSMTPIVTSGYGMYCGQAAGPSEPVMFENTHVLLILNQNNTTTQYAFYEWYEGFSWTGGTVEVYNEAGTASSYAFNGIYLGGNGPTRLAALDQYGSGPVLYYITINGSPTTLDELEYPNAIHVTGAHIAFGNNIWLTVIGTEYGSATNHGANLSISAVLGNAGLGACMLKTIGWSLGLQTSPFIVTSSPNLGMVGLTSANGSPTAAPIASQDYIAVTDLIINSSGGTGVSISIFDDFGNTIAQGLTSLTAFRMNPRMHINFGAFSTAPTVSVYQVGG